MIELTPEQQQALDEANGSPPVVIDPRTETTYRLVRLEKLEEFAPPAPIVGCPEMSEGVRRSKRAIRRDLPELLANRRNRGKFVCYHLEERVGIHRDYYALLREVIRRGIPDEEHMIERIAPDAGNEEELEF